MSKVTVLMSIYFKDNPEWLRHSLDSIIRQSLAHDEMILIKDGVLGEVLNKVIDEYKNKIQGLRVIENKKNMGLGLALKKGLECCSNEYVARMDADDYSRSDRFEKQVKVLQRGYDVVSSWTAVFEKDINEVKIIKKRPKDDSDLKKLAKKRCPISHPGTMFRKSAVLSCGGYEDNYLQEDYCLWVKMMMNGAKFYSIPEPLIYVRTSYDQIKRRGGLKYFISEINSQKFFYRIGFINEVEVVRNVVVRAVIRLLPRNTRGKVIEGIWRKDMISYDEISGEL